MLGSANITGGKLFHLMTGNLSHQIEHHLFPDLPARRYPQIADRGPGDLRALRPAVQHRPARASSSVSVAKKICRLALPTARADAVDDGPVVARSRSPLRTVP